MRARLRSQFVENLTWAGDEAGQVHLLLDAPHQSLSTKIRRHNLRRRLRPVSPVDDTGEVAFLNPLATLGTLRTNVQAYELLTGEALFNWRHPEAFQEWAKLF